MVMTEAISNIIGEIEEMKKDIHYIKEHMVDADSILTEDDYALLQEYRKEKKDGKLVPHEKLKKELGL